MELEASKTTSDPETVEAETSVRPGKQVKRPSMSLTPNSKRSLQAPQDCRRVGKRKPSLPPLYGFSTAVESDGELVVPTSQSQDLRPFFVSPPRPGGTDLFTDTTPKALRQSQGYIDQPLQPGPSYGSATAAEFDEELVVPTSQSQDLSPFCISPPRPGGTDPFTDTTPKALRQSSSAGRHFEASPKLSSQQQTGVFRTPTKPTSSSFNEMANVEK